MDNSNGVDLEQIIEAVFSNPNLEVISTARTPDGKPLDLKLLFVPAAMIADRLMEHVGGTMTVKRENDGAVGRPRMPRVFFSPDPRPNAFARIEGAREIHLNLGLIVALCSLPSAMSLLSQLLKEQSVAFSKLGELAQSDNLIQEIDGLMKSWKASDDEGWTVTVFPTSALTDYFLFQEMLRFAIAHEFGHWLHSIYKPDHQLGLLQTAEQDIMSWLGADTVTDRRVIENIKRLLQNPLVLEHWKLETCADAIGFQLCLGAYGGNHSPELRMGAYAGAALMFAVIGMLEMFFESIGKPLTSGTHPSSYARSLIFTHILAKQFSISHQEFLHKEYGAGTAVTMIMSEILSQYEARRMRMPTRV